MNFPKIEDIAIRENGELELRSCTWLNGLMECFIENITNEEQYEIIKTAHENGARAFWKLKDEV